MFTQQNILNLIFKKTFFKGNIRAEFFLFANEVIGKIMSENLSKANKI